MENDGATTGGVATPGVLLVATLLIAAGFCAMAMLNPSPSSVREADVDSNPVSYTHLTLPTKA